MNNSKTLNAQIKDYDYISFQKGTPHILKESLQAFSLEASQKQISCCDYYVHSKTLGNYLLFKANLAFQKLPKHEFEKLLDISQITVKKDFFLSHLSEFKKFFRGSIFSLINEENTVFISIPLVQINKIKNIDYKRMKEAFQMLFSNKLYSLNHQKRMISAYPIMLSLTALRERFIFKSLIEAVRDKNKLFRLKKGF